MIRFTAIAPALLKNMARAFGNRISPNVEHIAAINAKVAHPDSGPSTPLKPRAANMPNKAAARYRARHIHLFHLSPIPFRSHEELDVVVRNLMPELLTTPCKCPTPWTRRTRNPINFSELDDMDNCN